MKIKDLFEEITTDDGFSHVAIDHADYDVVLELNSLDNDPEGHIPIGSIRWDHNEKLLVLETD